MNTNVWEQYLKDSKKEQALTNFCEGYKNFLSNKTERECVRATTQMAENAGYKNLATLTSLKPGDKVYATNMDKCMILFKVGKMPLENGLNIVGSHIDSPRLDLKATPIYENNELCLLDTHYYGGIKKYQWTALPLAIHGVVVKKDGSKIDVVYGEDDNDAVVAITDLLPHLERDKKDKMDIKGEDLNVLVRLLAKKKTKLRQT